MKKFNPIPLFIACILSACLSPSEGDGSPIAPPKLNPTSSLTTVFTATPSQTPTPEPKPTPDPAQIAAEEMGKLNLVLGTDYTFATDENGKLAAFNADGVKIYEPNTHRWNSNLIAGIVENSLKITGDCEKTDIPRSGDIRPIHKYSIELIEDLLRENAFKPENRQKNQFIYLQSVSNPANNTFCWLFTLSHPQDPPEKPFIAFWRTEVGDETQIHFVDLFNLEK